MVGLYTGVVVRLFFIPACYTFLMVTSRTHRLLPTIAALIWVLFVLHTSALRYHLYWVFPWLDSAMHLLGGTWVGLATFWFFAFSGYVPRIVRPVSPTLMAFLAGIFLAVLWEYFELAVQSTAGIRFEGNWQIDTATDLLCGACGVLIGAFWGRRKSKSAADEASAAAIA